MITGLSLIIRLCARCSFTCAAHPVNLDITEYMREVDLKASVPTAMQADPDFE